MKTNISGQVYYIDNTIVFFQLQDEICINAISLLSIDDMLYIVQYFIEHNDIDWFNYRNDPQLVQIYNTANTVSDINGTNWITITNNNVVFRLYQIPHKLREQVKTFITKRTSLTISRSSFTYIHS